MAVVVAVVGRSIVIVAVLAYVVDEFCCPTLGRSFHRLIEILSSSPPINLDTPSDTLLPRYDVCRDGLKTHAYNYSLFMIVVVVSVKSCG